jgi:hypothetical protein
MKNQSRALFQLLIILGFAFLLIRFFPFVVQVGQGAALSIVKFWWVVLIIVMGIWVLWVLSKRNSG